MNILNETKPPGYDEWLQRVRNAVEVNPKAYGHLKREDGSIEFEQNSIQQKISWDGKVTRADAEPSGPGTQTEAERKGHRIAQDVAHEDKLAAEGELPTISDLEVEPALTADQ